jgi:hypothetical protein
MEMSASVCCVAIYIPNMRLVHLSHTAAKFRDYANGSGVVYDVEWDVADHWLMIARTFGGCRADG